MPPRRLVGAVEWLSSFFCLLSLVPWFLKGTGNLLSVAGALELYSGEMYYCCFKLHLFVKQEPSGYRACVKVKEQFGNQFSLEIVWIPWIELRLSGLMASAFPH